MDSQQEYKAFILLGRFIFSFLGACKPSIASHLFAPS
ncbi:hypothetical protein NEOC65_000519 [Neochlamydia sp. AcF65]|nr:hypothetical protein [Neochlamydia sp. AcF65]